ncbi:Adenosyl-chloride synthase [bacterium HR33]|nr:Adenosyl-chloride synthase [bacterium HR33]
MSPLVTLLTDFGYRDSYVAEMKAVLLSAVPSVQLVDISHEVPPGDVLAAQYILARTWARFPPGSVHLAVVDPGVGTDRRAIAVYSGGHYFVGPDNGLFTPVLDGARAVELSIPRTAAPTFHGRDVFAPAASLLIGGKPLEQLGAPVQDPIRLSLPQPVLEGGRVVGSVIYVDRFGTLVTNIGRDLSEGRTAVEIRGIRIPIRRTFGDVEPGELVAFVGSGGTVEIAVRDGAAAAKLGAGVGEPVRC